MSDSKCDICGGSPVVGELYWTRQDDGRDHAFYVCEDCKKRFLKTMEDAKAKNLS